MSVDDKEKIYTSLVKSELVCARHRGHKGRTVLACIFRAKPMSPSAGGRGRMSPLMFSGSTAGLLLKGSSPSTASGGVCPGLAPPSPGYYSSGGSAPCCCQYPLSEASGPTLLGHKVGFAKQAAR